MLTEENAELHHVEHHFRKAYTFLRFYLRKKNRIKKVKRQSQKKSMGEDVWEKVLLLSSS